MPSRLLLSALGAAALAVSTGLAVPQQPTFRTGTDVVSLFATVTDAERRLVPDLTMDDFEVFDNDKPQPIIYFENAVRPISVVVMLDTSGSMTGSIALLKQAAEQFLLRLLADDRGRVGAFNDKVEISSRFTNNRDELISAVKNLDFGNGTRLWDALMVALDALDGVDGRRVILVLTDGDDSASRARQGTVIDRARAQEAMIYAIGLQSNYFDGLRMVRSRPDSGLRKLADETGGGYFELDKAAELSPTFTRVAQELHGQYVIGFTPTELDGRVHKLALRVKGAGMTARARRSYLASPAASATRDKS